MKILTLTPAFLVMKYVNKKIKNNYNSLNPDQPSQNLFDFVNNSIFEFEFDD